MGHFRKQQISFFLTTECTLKCNYCYTLKDIDVKKEHQTLNFNFAKQGMLDFFRKFQSREIRFYGAGEPTREFKLMKKIKDFAFELAGNELKVELQTNGFFDTYIAEWIANNINILWISCDGMPEIHDHNRKTKKGTITSHIVERNLKFFAQQKHMQVGVRITVTPESINRQCEIIKYFHKLGIKYVNAHPACAPIHKQAQENLFKWDPLEFAKNFLEAHNEANKLGIFYNSLYIVNFDEKVDYACRALVPCPHLTTDEYVSSCDFAQFGPEYDPGPMQQFIYGKYIPKDDKIIYDENKIKMLRNRCTETLLNGKCKDCEVAYYCAGGCVGQVVNENSDLLEIHKKNCLITKYLSRHIPLGKKKWPVFHS